MKGEEGRERTTSCPPKPLLSFHSNRDVAGTRLARQELHLPAPLAAGCGHVPDVSRSLVCSFCLSYLRVNLRPWTTFSLLIRNASTMVNLEVTFRDSGNHYPRSLDDWVEETYPPTWNTTLDPTTLDLLIKAYQFFISFLKSPGNICEYFSLLFYTITFNIYYLHFLVLYTVFYSVLFGVILFCSCIANNWGQGGLHWIRADQTKIEALRAT